MLLILLFFLLLGLDHLIMHLWHETIEDKIDESLDMLNLIGARLLHYYEHLVDLSNQHRHLLTLKEHFDVSDEILLLLYTSLCIF